MFKYIRKNVEYKHDGYKIRIIKADLAKKVSLKPSDIILVYKNIILEDSERITHYLIDQNDYIWFGMKGEYDQEYGHHIAIELITDYSVDAISVTEKVLVRKNDRISRVRYLLTRIYKWITKVKFYNYQKILLLDDQTIEEYQLVDHPIINIGTPVLKVTRGSHREVLRNTVQYGNAMRLSPFEISPLMETFKIVTDLNYPNGSILSRLLDFIEMNNPEDNNVKSDFISLISDWVKYFERAENNQLSVEDITSIYRQDFGGYLEDITDEVELATTDEHLEAMHKLFVISSKFCKKYFPTYFDPLEKVLEPIFEAFLSRRYTFIENDMFVDMRLANRLNYFINKFFNDGSPLNDHEFTLKIFLILPDILPIICKFNSIITEYWSRVFYSQENRFRSAFVHPNLNNEKPVLIFSPAEVTIIETKKILSNENNEKNIYLATSKFDRFYKDDEVLPTEGNISSVTVSQYKFDHFEKIKRIGKGGWGSVYLYLNKLTNQRTVLKKLKIPEGKKLEEANELIREVITFSQIAPHRRIIQYMDYFITGRSFYIEMEFMEGGSLKNYLDKNKPIDEKKIKHFSSQILEGLSYLHGKSIFHRDIKTENVLLDKDENAKLTDFGLTKCFYESNDNFREGIKQSGVGTEKWMAPEIFKSCIYGPAADIWSFGMTLIEMVTGGEPYPRLTVFGIHKKITKIGTRELRGKISNYLHQFIDSCLKINPEERFTVDQLLESEFIK